MCIRDSIIDTLFVHQVAAIYKIVAVFGQSTILIRIVEGGGSKLDWEKIISMLVEARAGSLSKDGRDGRNNKLLVEIYL